LQQERLSMSARPALRLLRPLRVDIEALERAWDDDGDDASRMLDLATGQVVTVPRDDAIAARRVARDVGRYLPIPADDPTDLRDDMDAYTAEHDDPRIRRRLREALRSRDPARKFHSVLWDEDQLDEWSVYQHGRLERRIVEWLATHGIAAVFEEG
jgi:hypothetical protein